MFTTGLRLNLQADLEACAGNQNVYFQPPENIALKYPCIIYQRDNSHTIFADNDPYQRFKRYMVTVIDANPDGPIPDRVAELPTCTHIRFFVANNLNHDVFNLYY